MSYVVCRTAIMSCDIHTHTPARNSSTKVLKTSICTILLNKIVTQTVLGMGMGMNITAHIREKGKLQPESGRLVSG